MLKKNRRVGGSQEGLFCGRVLHEAPFPWRTNVDKRRWNPRLRSKRETIRSLSYFPVETTGRGAQLRHGLLVVIGDGECGHLHVRVIGASGKTRVKRPGRPLQRVWA